MGDIQELIPLNLVTCFQTRIKCWNAETTFRAEQGPCEPSKGNYCCNYVKRRNFVAKRCKAVKYDICCRKQIYSVPWAEENGMHCVPSRLRILSLHCFQVCICFKSRMHKCCLYPCLLQAALFIFSWKIGGYISLWRLSAGRQADGESTSGGGEKGPWAERGGGPETQIKHHKTALLSFWSQGRSWVQSLGSIMEWPIVFTF